jgi:hypothetical protein
MKTVALNTAISLSDLLSLAGDLLLKSPEGREFILAPDR